MQIKYFIRCNNMIKSVKLMSGGGLYFQRVVHLPLKTEKNYSHFIININITIIEAFLF